MKLGGEGDNGMKAVASVVMNRVNASEGEYARVSQGGSIRNIIYQPGQFDCTRETINGQYNSQNIYNMTPTDLEYRCPQIPPPPPGPKVPRTRYSGGPPPHSGPPSPYSR